MKLNVKRDGIDFSYGGYDYRIESEPIEGDFSTVYLGKRHNGSELENICIKIADDTEDNDLLIRESNVLQNLDHKSIPKYLDTFCLDDGKRVNVLEKIEDGYDLYSIREHFPNGLEHHHAGWVFQRLLSALGYLHVKKIIHGGIEPGNIMVTPKNHNGLLMDFSFAVADANESSAKYFGINDYSAPEIKKGAKPHPASDLYSLGLSMVYLFGGKGKKLPKDVDPKLAKFIDNFLKENPKSRKNDAWQAWHELKDIRKKVFGPHKFIELNINGGK